MPTKREGRRPRFAAGLETGPMDDIDALEIYDDEYSIHSQASKRFRVFQTTALIPEGWPALHSAMDIMGPSVSARSPMTLASARLPVAIPQQVSTGRPASQLAPSGRRATPGITRLQSPQHGRPPISQTAPSEHAQRGQCTSSFAGLEPSQSSLPPSQATVLGTEPSQGVPRV